MVARLLAFPSLYAQCAATPNSAIRCISDVRICTSSGSPFGPITVVCKRLIHIRLWHRNIIFKSARHRLPTCMNDSKNCIAIFNTIHNDPYRKQIINFTKLFILQRHFSINAINMFWSARNLSFNCTSSTCLRTSSMTFILNILHVLHVFSSLN